MESLIWYATWPVVIFITWKFVYLNIRHHHNMERLEAFEEEARLKAEK
jgi:glycerol-3-phosphate acyltransferase PlsY